MSEHEQAISIKERARRKLERDMGPECLAALNDPKTVEIMLNADGRLWQERLGEPMRCIGAMRVAQACALSRMRRGSRRAMRTGVPAAMPPPGKKSAPVALSSWRGVRMMKAP